MKSNNIFSKLLTFLRLAFSEGGIPSSKRILGGFIIIVVLFCTTWSVVKFGMTENNKSVIEFEIVTAGALLGVSSVTAIWKNNNGSTSINPSQYIENPEEDEK